MIQHAIPASVPETPLGRYIARAWPLLPAGALRTLFKRRDAKVNGQRRGQDFPVRGGDHLTLYLDEDLFAGPLATVFDDGRLIAAVKPQGLPVDADRDGIGADTLLTRLRARHPAAELCHRLDAGTGGIVLAAADGTVLQAVLAAFRERRLEKRYIALAAGAFSAGEGVWRDHLVKDGRNALVRVSERPVAGRSRPIETRWRVLESLPGGLTRLELEPVTGRTHQLRAHAAFHGHPLLGDDKYGDRALNRAHPMKYPCLWCASVTLETAEGLEAYAGKPFAAEAPDWLEESGNVR